MFESRVIDKKPYIEVKNAIVARSGIYKYTRAEILARGHKPARVKDFYDEFRPPAVIAAAAGLFDMVPVPNREHADEDITPDNFRDNVSAMVGGPIEIVPMANGVDIGLQGRIAFFTKEAYNYYKAGNVETSADYVSESELVDNPEEVGYDLIVKKIISVNNVAITAMGRGGKEVRIMDSVKPGRIFDKVRGRRNMGLLYTLLGIGKESEEPKMSAVVKDSLTALKSAKAEEREGIVEGVLDRIARITDSPERATLEGIVRDAIANPDAVLARWNDSEKLIEGVYARCMDTEAQALAQVTDAKPKSESESKSDDDDDDADDEVKKKAKAQDTALAAFDAKIDELKAAIPGMIEAGVKKILQPGEKPKGQRNLDSAPESLLGADEDVSFALDGAFGNRK